MGPFTIYPLFLLPLLFWISPIASTSTEVEVTAAAATGKSDLDKDLKVHDGYPQLNPSEPELRDQENAFYANQPLDLQQPLSHRDRYYSPAPISYYPYYNYHNMYNYPQPNPYANPQSGMYSGPQPNMYAGPQPNMYSSPQAYGYAGMNPMNQYIPQNPFAPPMPPPNYQSQMYDPYVMMMHLAQPSKYQSPSFSSIMSPTPPHMYQSGQPMTPYYSQQAKPMNEALSSLPNEPQSIMSSYSPDNAYTLYTAFSPGGSEQASFQSTTGSSHGQAQTSPSNYHQSTSSSMMFSSLSPDTQQMLQSLISPSSLGYMEKKSRNPNEDPSEIARSPPPKAIMTTASDILGLRGHSAPKFNFHYTPDSQKETLHRYVSKNGEHQYKRKPPVFSFNNINNNKKFSFPGGLDLQVPKKYIAKAANETQNPDTDCENCEDNRDYISEPIISASVLSSPHGGIDEYIEAVLAKSKKTSPSSHSSSSNAKKPFNIMPNDADEPIPEMHVSNRLTDDPMPLFQVQDGDEEEEDSLAYNSQQDMFDDEKLKQQIYRCPLSRNLRELSQAEIFPDPLKCDQFYYCKSGRAYIFKCPINHAFNPVSNLCERDDDYACAMTLKKKK